jgi:purine nucleosidase
MKNTLLIIDTDPGVDDALAIMLAAHSGFQILGMTTVFGNRPVEVTTQNACVIASILASNIPVYRGASVPLQGDAPVAESHGTSGLGGLDVSQFSGIPQKKNAQDFLNDTLTTSSNITLVCIGPMTNLAEFAKKEPALAAKIQTLVMMGGVFHEPGNISLLAEFNAYCDPLAFQTVINLPVPKILISADVCRKVLYSLEEFTSIADAKTSQNIRDIVSGYIRYYQKDKKHGGFSGGVMYDVLTIAYLLEPTFFSAHEACVSISIKEDITRGQTIEVPAGKPNCLLVDNVDAKRVKQLFFERICR